VSTDHGNGAPVLSVRDVSKSFGGVRALKGVSLEIYRGEILALVGDNGAGKSTLVKIISGAHQPTSGDLLLEDEPLALASPAEARARGIETVYQHLALVDKFDVTANFFLGKEVTLTGWLKPFGFMRQRKMRRLAGDKLHDLHIKIPGLAEATVERMSGGQRQAVAIGRAAFWQSKLLLLDEPTAALGVEESAEVLRLMREMVSEQGTTILMVSHNMEHVWSVCDRIVVLRQGEKVANVRKEESSLSEVVGFITGAHLVGDLAPAPDRG
jgi:ABC-type sugar transport system ATPase subunit